MDRIAENLVEIVAALPNGRERTLAITKLEEAQMWAYAALEVKGKI
jgi:hypothetical protein